jgi:hypothetical protein
MARSVARRRRTEAAALPEWIAPQLTQLVDAAPDGDPWLHEIKFDGYRMHARLDRGAVKLLTRTGLDWTHKYPAIAEALSSLGARQAYLDGELCGVGPDGITSFSMIQLASDSGNAAALVFFLFDLIYVDGEDLMAQPLIDRKTRLAALLSNVPSPLHPSGEADRRALRPDFDRRLMLQFHGTAITSDAGLLAYRELDDTLGLTDTGADRLADGRTGRNGRHRLAGLLRQGCQPWAIRHVPDGRNRGVASDVRRNPGADRQAAGAARASMTEAAVRCDGRRCGCSSADAQ